jgi:hypothetical protein
MGTRGSRRNVSPRTLALTAAAVAMVALVVGTQVPQVVAGANASMVSSVVPATNGTKLALNWSCMGCASAGFNITPKACVAEGSGWQLCDVLMWVPADAPGTCSSSVGQISYLQLFYPTGREPFKFSFVNSDPTFPSPGPNCAQNVANLYEFWFHTVPATGNLHGKVVISAQ